MILPEPIASSRKIRKSAIFFDEDVEDDEDGLSKIDRFCGVYKKRKIMVEKLISVDECSPVLSPLDSYLSFKYIYVGWL